MKSMTSANGYREASSSFIQRIYEDSPGAAACLEQIRASSGDRAAYLAGFALVLLKERHIKHDYPMTHNELSSYTFYEEMEYNVEVIRLYEEAARQLLVTVLPLDGDGHA